MKITKIAPQAKNPDRVNVYVNGGFYCGLDKGVALELGLAPGKLLTSELTKTLAVKDEFARGWEYALRCLQRSAQSEHEMTRKLSLRLEDQTLVNQIIQRLTESGLLDDVRLAEHLIQKYAATQSKSGREIKLLLRRKGIDTAVINQLSSTVDEIDPKVAITKLAIAKLRRIKNEEPKIRFQKTAAYLAQKGFSYKEIKEVLETVELPSQS